MNELGCTHILEAVGVRVSHRSLTSCDFSHALPIRLVPLSHARSHFMRLSAQYAISITIEFQTTSNES